MAKKQTAGRDRLGTLAPKFAELNDDVLFGEVWSREDQLFKVHMKRRPMHFCGRRLNFHRVYISEVITSW